MASLFDSSDDSEGEEDGAVLVAPGAGAAQLGPVLARVKLFVHGRTGACVEDLKGTCSRGDLGEALEQAVGLLDAGDYARCAVLCETHADAAWAALLRDKAWPHKAWNELFIFCKLILACCRVALGDFGAAVTAADFAFVVGAPKEETNLFFRLVDPLVRAARKGSGQAGTFLHGELPGAAQAAISGPQSEQELAAVVAALSPGVKLEPVRRLAAPSLEQLEDVCSSATTPVVLQGMAEGWAALDKWRSLAFWDSEYGHRVVPVEIGDALARMEEHAMPLGQFVREYLAPAVASEGSRRVAYLAQHNIFDQLPDLRRDFSVPLFCSHKGNVPTNSSIWLGTDSTVTLLHFDSYSNLLVQVAGLKYVVLFPPDQTPNLYVHKTHCGQEDQGADPSLLEQNNTSSVDVGRPDFDMHPLYKSATGYQVLLRPGDTLFIPRGVWHYVQSLTPSLSANFWFSMDDFEPTK